MGREVAIKISTDSFGDRFALEVRAAAALNHPHICHLYDVGPNYLVMEMVEGLTLAERLRQGPLLPTELLTVAKQVAGALAAAHEKGIVHCDLKPGNIKIKPDGSVKVLDLGLAEWIGPQGAASLADQSSEGAIGTADYMSPEQTEGRALDARSDIFSFGLVLEEILRALTSVKEDSRQSIAAIVARCIRKEPGERFQSVAELRAALERISAADAEQPSIAVLPFANLTVEPEDDYFSDGLAEEIINALARVPALRVTARTSSFAFRGAQQDIRQIAQTLGVGMILEGSVRRSGSRIRVAAQLISAIDGYPVWSDTYNRETADIFAVQNDIATAIANSLKVEITAIRSPAARYTPRFPAYEALLKGRHYLLKITPHALKRAKECFEEAITLDPDYPDPHDELGNHYLFLCLAGVCGAKDMVPLVCSQAHRALTLDPSLPRPHALLGFVAAAHDYDWTEAENQFRLALAARSVSGDVRYWYAFSYLPLWGRFDEAVEQLGKALELDPLNVFWRINLAGVFHIKGDFQRSLFETRKVLEIDESYWVGYLGLGANYLGLRKLPEAVAALERAYTSAPWNPQIVGQLAGALSLSGDENRAERLVEQIQAPYSVPMCMALYHSICSRAESAADWFVKSIEVRDPSVLVYVRNPLTSAIRESSRWPELAGMLNLSPEIPFSSP